MTTQTPGGGASSEAAGGRRGGGWDAGLLEAPAEGGRGRDWRREEPAKGGRNRPREAGTGGGRNQRREGGTGGGGRRDCWLRRQQMNGEGGIGGGREMTTGRCVCSRWGTWEGNLGRGNSLEGIIREVLLSCNIRFDVVFSNERACCSVGCSV